MSGLLRRMRRGRASADPAPDSGDARAGGDAPQTGAPVEGGVPAVPAGSDLDQLVGAPPDSRRRSKVRRRLRHLRRVREVLLRDLGGFVFELHRSPGAQSQAETDLVAAKLDRVGRVDTELRELETELDDRRPMVVREPGIGGACAVCGELFGSEARFCWACGTPVAPGAVRPVSAVAAATGAAALSVPELAAGVQQAAQPQPSASPPPPPPPPIPHIEGTSEELPIVLPDAPDTAGPDDPTSLHDRGAPDTAGPDDPTSLHDRVPPAPPAGPPDPDAVRPAPPEDRS
jgi:hypothetical protein